MKPLWTCAALAAGLAGCSMGADLTQAQTQVDVFHNNLNAGRFDLIYTNAAPELKRATTQAQMTQLLDAVHRKLGPFGSGAFGGYNDNLTTNGHFVTLTYAAKYARGAAEERFVYKLDGSAASLVGYNINSTALITN